MWAIFEVFIVFVTVLLLLFMFCFFDWEACVIVVPWPGTERSPPALEGEVSTTGPPGQSLGWVLMLLIILFQICVLVWTWKLYSFVLQIE